MTAKPLLLLVNPTAAAGRALRRLPAVTAELERLGAEHRVLKTRSIDHAREEAAAAARRGAEAVAALGGDGFVRPIAGELRGTDTPLAILPGGRGNDFARVLGIPTEPAEAARVAAGTEEREVDVAEVNGEPYVGIASFGFDSECNRIANEAKLVRGNLVYLYSALRTVATWKHARFRVSVDGEEHRLTGWSVAVANSKAFGGGMFLAPHASLQDGLLDVVAIEESSKWGYVKGLPSVFKGTHLERDQVKVFRGAEISVEADRPFDVYADGDAVAKLPATMRVSGGPLRVRVPPGGPGTSA